MVALSTAATTAAASEICVIGAGAAGLVTARHLLQAGLRPTILESSNEIGGLWQQASMQHHKRQRPRTWDSMRTNLSRYTCCFSDYPWSMATGSHNLHPPPTSTTRDNNNALSFFFPTAEQVHQYLKSYSRHFLEDESSSCTFRFGCQVSKVTPTDNCRYAVEWNDNTMANGESDQQQQQQVFDGVVVASGFFSEPVWPDNVSSFTGRHIHSSQYHNPEDVMDSQEGSMSSVAVCGASFSALEIAVDLARKQSFSSSQGRVIHICPSMPWVMPRFLPDPEPTTSPKHGFVPVDLALYRRTNDGIKAEQVLGNDPSVNVKKHEALKTLLGTQMQQHAFASMPMAQPWDDPTQPVFASISDDYLDLVQRGRIELVPGRLIGCDETTGALRVTETSTASETLLTNVETLISGTGYHTNLDFLDPSILDTLEYDRNNMFAPLVLCDDVYHPRLPNLAFVGLYRGPYFGVMELQARLAVCRFLEQQQQEEDGRTDTKNGKRNAEEDRLALEEARQIRAQSPQPQFPRGDLVGRMDALASKLQKRYPSQFHGLGENTNTIPHFRQKGHMVLPVMYQPDEKLAAAVVEEVELELQRYCTNPSHMTPRLLQSLVGTWKFDRTLTQLSDGSKQFVSGQVQFSQQQHDNEADIKDYVLYREDGVMELPNGQPIEVFREYHYQFNPDNGAMEIFFVEAGERAHMFLSLLFESNGSSSSKASSNWVARNDHLCIKDLYDAEFQVSLEGLAAQHVQMKYKVKGPSKNYEAMTILTPT